MLRFVLICCMLLLLLSFGLLLLLCYVCCERFSAMLLSCVLLLLLHSLSRAVAVWNCRPMDVFVLVSLSLWSSICVKIYTCDIDDCRSIHTQNHWASHCWAVRFKPIRFDNSSFVFVSIDARLLLYRKHIDGHVMNGQVLCMQVNA